MEQAQPDNMKLEYEKYKAMKKMEAEAIQLQAMKQSQDMAYETIFGNSQQGTISLEKDPKMSCGDQEKVVI